MSDEVQLEGKTYISSKRASKLSGYAQDYIGQLSRGALIDARRVGGLWYVSADSLNAYKAQAETFTPTPPQHQNSSQESEMVVSFDGKDYVSANRASKITGYHQDYVGQLARSGKIQSRQVGNRWFVDRNALEAHKNEKDALLGAVQTQAVGIARHEKPESESQEASFFTYTPDSKNMLPEIEASKEAQNDQQADFEEQKQSTSIPIRIGRPQPAYTNIEKGYSMDSIRPKTLSWKASSALIGATFLITGSFIGWTVLHTDKVASRSEAQSAAANFGILALESFAGTVEGLLGHEIIYTKNS